MVRELIFTRGTCGLIVISFHILSLQCSDPQVPKRNTFEQIISAFSVSGIEWRAATNTWSCSELCQKWNATAHVAMGSRGKTGTNFDRHVSFRCQMWWIECCDCFSTGGVSSGNIEKSSTTWIWCHLLSGCFWWHWIVASWCVSHLWGFVPGICEHNSPHQYSQVRPAEQTTSIWDAKQKRETKATWPFEFQHVCLDDWWIWFGRTKASLDSFSGYNGKVIFVLSHRTRCVWYAFESHQWVILLSAYRLFCWTVSLF